MRDHSTQWDPSERLQIEYTDKPVSGWGGLVALARYWDQLGLRTVLQQALPDGRTSPNQILAVEIVLAFFAAVLTGATRLAHMQPLRAEPSGTPGPEALIQPPHSLGECNPRRHCGSDAESEDHFSLLVERDDRVAIL